MTPLLHASLVNPPFGDPGVYLDVRFARRGLLFDLGDLHALPSRKILRLSDILVSHMHVDHFIGFDQVLRVLVGRDQELRLYGPRGIITAVEHRLAGYSWNLAERYNSDLVLEVTEVLSAGEARSAAFRLSSRFRREEKGARPLANGIVLDDGLIRVRAAVLDHGIPCLAYAVQERAHVNVWKSKLEERGLAVGPWLRELKEAVLRDEPDETPIRVRVRQNGGGRDSVLPLGLLKSEVLRIVPGQKIAYVVDTTFTEESIGRIVELARGADTLFIEACFARDDHERAAERRHLTTAQAGYLARQADVRRMVPFHFSPRYSGEEDRLRQEAGEAFAGSDQPPGAPRSQWRGEHG